MKQTVLLWLAIAASLECSGQVMEALMKPVPAAICKEAAMPEEMARKFARLETERQQKWISPSTKSVPNVDQSVLQKKNQYVEPSSAAFRLRYTPSDRYVFCYPDLKLANTSHGREGIKDTEGKFNPKKDRISYAVIEGNRINIIKQDHRRLNMSEFRFTVEEGEAIEMEGNAIVIQVPLLSIAQGHYPWTYRIKCEHPASGAQYTFDLQLAWKKEMDLAGQLHAFALSPIASEAADNMGLLCDLDTKQFHIVRLPFLIQAEGTDGKDGRRGHTGASGTNEKTYKDSDGNTHRIAGTCGSRGQDGTDGTDGTDGGRFLLCVSPELVSAYGRDGMIATIDAGRGGKGGKGGQGGKHGTGSGCNGKAADGRDGKDGKDGQRGDFLYVLTDVNEMYNDIVKGAL